MPTIFYIFASMNVKLFTHIEFLLSKHNCVMIPNLGGFILNQNKSSVGDLSYVYTPRYSISFNADLNYDDGILTSHIAQSGNTTYNLASKKVGDAVRNIKKELKLEGTIACANLGSLSLNKDNSTLTFEANGQYTHPSLYGLSDLSIKKLTRIDKQIKKEIKHVSFLQAIGTISAAAAAIALLITPISSIKESNSSNIQQASFIQSISTPSEVDANNISTPNYYIILNSEDTLEKAEAKLSEITEEAFPNAEILISKDKYRIYVGSFSEKDEATSFLADFRKDNPTYKNVWLYTQPN